MTTDVATQESVRGAGRELGRPPSVWSTGARLPEVRWAALALALFLIGWALQLTGAPDWTWWIAFLACYAAGGWEPTLAGIEALREKTLDVDLLMIVAAIAAASIGQVFDGALLIVIFATSGSLEAIVTQRTAASVSSLLDLAPEQAALLNDSGTEIDVDTQDLVMGQRILVRPGERIGADGTVVEGVSEVDQQAITGESVPVVKSVGDAVLSGTVNGTGVLTIRVERPAAESVVARIVTMVEQASATKARTQLFIEKVEQRYSAGVIVATLLVLVIPMLVLDQSFEAALLRAITFMIVASPCAVVLSTMPPLLAAMANAGRHGVLVKSATVMETLGRTDTVAFDKTGTLTEGAPAVEHVLATDTDPDEVLRLAAAVEQYSEHPLGRAITHAARARGLDIPDATDFRAFPGRGVSGTVAEATITVQRGATTDDTTGTVVAVLDGDDPIGVITLTDRIRTDAHETVSTLTDVGVRTHLLTGDNQKTANEVAGQVGILDVHAALLPEDKTRIVEQLEQSGRTVMLVGDGVNDAPALASATTGVAMGRHGSDLALDTADAIIVRDELTAIPTLIRLSARARNYVIANLIIAGCFITILVTWDLVASLPLPLAVAGHEGSTVIVALNGLRLLRKHAWRK